MSTEGQTAQEEKTSLLKRPIGGSGKKAEPRPKQGKFGIPALPQVNLMPPEVLGGRKVAVLKRQLVWVIILLLVLCVLAFGAAYVLRAQADNRYEDAVAHADTLTAQKKQYAPVVVVQRDIGNTQDARTFVLLSEVNWNNYIYMIEGVLPEGVTIETMNVTGTGAGSDPLEGPDDLTRTGIAVISFSANSLTLPDASEWIDALESVPGLVDVNLQSSVLEDETGEPMYQVTVTVQVTEEALALRTFPDQAPAAEDESTESDTEGEG